jgi:hypothetical protein
LAQHIVDLVAHLVLELAVAALELFHHDGLHKRPGLCEQKKLQGTFGMIQGTFGVIQGTFGGIRGTFGMIQETFGMIQEHSACFREHSLRPQSSRIDVRLSISYII